MYWKKALVVLAGVGFPTWGILNYFVRLQGITTNSPLRSVNMGFALIGLMPIGGLFLHQKGFWDKIYVGGLTMLGLTVPSALLGYYTRYSVWHWAVWFMLPFMFIMGCAMILHAKAHTEPVKLVHEDEVPYCPKCENVFPFAKKGDSCENGCLP